MSLNLRQESEEAGIMASLGSMRSTLRSLEDAAPGLTRLTIEMRLGMMDLTARVKALTCTTAAARMTGERPPIAAPGRVDEMPLFAHGHVLTALDVKRMEDRRHWEGDRTQDSTDEDETIDDEEGAR